MQRKKERGRNKYEGQLCQLLDCESLEVRHSVQQVVVCNGEVKYLARL